MVTCHWKVNCPRGKISCQVFGYDFEIFLAAAVMTGSTCVVQCHNNKSNHRAGIFLHCSPASGPAMEKRTMFLLTHSANFNPRSVLITSRTSFSRRLFMSQDLRGRLFHCPFQLYRKKDRKKTLSARTRRKVTYLIL